MFIAHHSVANGRKQPTCPSVDEWTDKMWPTQGNRHLRKEGGMVALRTSC